VSLPYLALGTATDTGRTKAVFVCEVKMDDLERDIEHLKSLPIEDRCQELLRDSNFWIGRIKAKKIEAEQLWGIAFCNDCLHINKKLVYYTDSLNRKQYVNQCTLCGYKGNAVSVKGWPASTINAIPEKRQIDYAALRAVLHDTFNQAFNDLYHADFEAYYKTTEWSAKRAKVLQRDRNTCQICGAHTFIVHHLTYAHFRDEYLFELVSLCGPCHQGKYHPEKMVDL
jgi:hypothetical protein